MKDFDKWNTLKKDLDKKEKSYKFKEREIWWISLGQNISSESYGKWENFRRPVLILKKLSSYSCIAIPLSTQIKTWTWFCECELDDIKRVALLNQIRMIDTNRFESKIWKLNSNEFDKIKEKLSKLLNLSNRHSPKDGEISDECQNA